MGAQCGGLRGIRQIMQIFKEQGRKQSGKISNAVHNDFALFTWMEILSNLWHLWLIKHKHFYISYLI